MKASPSLPAHVRWASCAAPGAVMPIAIEISPADAVDTAARHAVEHREVRRKRRPRSPHPRRDYKPRSPKAPTPTPAPSPDPLPPAAELDRLIDVAVTTAKIERARVELSETKEIARRLTRELHPHCPVCTQSLDRDASKQFRAELLAAIDTLQVDIAYFAQRLAQLGETGFPTRADAPFDETDAAVDVDVVGFIDDLPF